MGTPQIIDTITIAVFVCAFITGAKKGFVNIIAKFISRIAGLILCKPLSGILYQMFGNSINALFLTFFMSLDSDSLNFPESQINSALGIAGNYAALQISQKFTNITLAIIAFAIIVATVEIIVSVFKIAENLCVLKSLSKILGGVCECVSVLLLIIFLILILVVLQSIHITIADTVLNILCQGKIFQYIFSTICSLLVII